MIDVLAKHYKVEMLTGDQKGNIHKYVHEHVTLKEENAAVAVNAAPGTQLAATGAEAATGAATAAPVVRAGPTDKMWDVFDTQ